MKQVVFAAPAIAVAVLLAGCSGDDGMDGMDGASGANGLNSLVNTRQLPKGDADCPGGGLVFESGLDTNRNGTLDPSEVTATEFLECATAPQLRALHASPDAPAVNIIVNGAQALAGVDYTQGSGFLPVTETTEVQVEAIVPGGNVTVIDATLPLDFSTDYTVIAVGQVATPISALLIENPTGELITQGSFRAQVVHAAPNAPAVDVYVTAPTATLASSTPVATALTFQDFTGRLEVPAGTYRIRVTTTGNTDPASVVFDSGELPLAAGADLLIAAVENTGPGDTPIQLVALDGTTSFQLLDANTPASVVAVHASPDAPAVDILADVLSTATVEALPLAVNLPFAQACEIPAVPSPGDYGLSVTATGDPATVPLQFDLSTAKGDELTAIVTGFAFTTPAIQALPLITSTRSVFTEAKLRVVHASPSTGNVDVYLLADGTDFNAASTTPSLPAVPYGADSGILSVAPGLYDVYVTPAGNKSVVAIEVQNFPLSGGDVLDVIARDPAANGSEGALPLPLVVNYATVAACGT